MFGPTCKSVISDASGARADVLVKAGEVLNCGNIQLECRSTPGTWAHSEADRAGHNHLSLCQLRRSNHSPFTSIRPHLASERSLIKFCAAIPSTTIK